MKRTLLAAAVALGVACFAVEASAQAAPYAGIGIGPAIRMDDWPNQFRVEQEIGLTFGGRTGFFLAFAPSQSWGNDFWVLVFPARLGGVFDLFRNDDLRFQIGGSGTVGIALSDEFDSRTDLDVWFHLSVGLLLRFVILQDKLAIYVRPVNFEFGIGESNRGGVGNEVIRYIAVGGVQYYF